MDNLLPLVPKWSRPGQWMYRRGSLLRLESFAARVSIVMSLGKRAVGWRLRPISTDINQLSCQSWGFTPWWFPGRKLLYGCKALNIFLSARIRLTEIQFTGVHRDMTCSFLTSGNWSKIAFFFFLKRCLHFSWNCISITVVQCMTIQASIAPCFPANWAINN